jgi:uroporphyrinogen-III synthase
MGTVRSSSRWVDVCELARLSFDRGVCALVDGQQVALFRVAPSGELYAVSNYDPFSKAFVLSRGIVGSKGDIVKVASPVYKNAFCLRTGASLDDANVRLRTYPIRVTGGRVQVAAVRPDEGACAAPQRKGALAGRTIAIAESREAALLTRMLVEKGATVVGYPLVRIVDPPDPAPVEAFVRELCRGKLDALVLFTGEGVRRLLDVARRLEMEAETIAALHRIWIATRGPKPARALRELGVLPTVPTEHPTTEGIIEALQTREWNGARVGVQLCGDTPNDRVTSFLLQAGAESVPVAPYAYVAAVDDDKIVHLIRDMALGTVDVAAFTCSVQVDRLFDAAKARGIDDTLRRGLRRTKIAALGPVVATALRDRGTGVDIMPPRSFFMRSLLNEIVSSLMKKPANAPRRLA